MGRRDDDDDDRGRASGLYPRRSALRVVHERPLGIHDCVTRAGYDAGPDIPTAAGLRPIDEAEQLELVRRFFDDRSPLRDGLGSEDPSMTTRSERSELRGTVLDGRYRIGACIGVGGTGVVFEAVRLTDGETVVVKTMRPVYAYNPDLNRRLRREAEIARVVGHHGIVPVYDEGTLDDGSPYIVMKRLRGESLARLLMRETTIDEAAVAVIAMRVASILHAAHAHGYVHRDIKPEHILLDRAPDGTLDVCVLDFGVCAAHTAPEDEKNRERGRVYGTPTYVSPEQAMGNPDVDARADIFGLGIVMFECLTGRVPFSASNVANLLRRIIREDAPRVGLVAPHVSREMDEVISRALAREADNRVLSMRTLARALVPIAGTRLDVERRLAARLRLGSAAVESVETFQEAAA